MFRLADTATVAELLGVTPAFVREHAADLGAMRLHDGDRAPLRFDLDDVEARVRARRVDQPRTTVPQRRRRPGPRRAPAGVDLLPLPEDTR